MRQTIISVGVSVVISVAATIGLMSAIHPPMVDAQSQILTAQRFQLVDSQNRTIGFWGPTTNGTTVMSLAQPATSERVEMAISPDGSAFFSIKDAQGVERATLRLTGGDQSAGAILFDAKGARAGMVVTAEGEPSVAVFNADGSYRNGL